MFILLILLYVLSNKGCAEETCTTEVVKITAQWLMSNTDFLWFWRLIFRPKEGELVSLVQGGDAVVFVKSSETRQSRRQQRWRPLHFHWLLIFIFIFKTLSFRLWVFRQHRLKHHWSFFKQGINEASADTSKEPALLHHESTEIMTETSTKVNTTTALWFY